MYLEYMRIQNYQIFEDIELHFHEDVNYIVGENSVGKSSFLGLLGQLTEGRGFSERDYNNPDKPIIIEAHINLFEEEGDTCACLPEAVKEKGRYAIRFEQRVDEVVPRIYNIRTGEELPLNIIRISRYISYSAIQPEEYYISSRIYSRLEERLRKWNEAGDDRIDKLAKELITYYQDHGQFEPSYYANMGHLFQLMTPSSQSTVDNIQVIANVILKILLQIYKMYYSKAVPFEQLLITAKSGKRYLPLMISIDEPEVHSHPYMQRSILDYYKRILNNEDEDFCRLLKNLFHIDGVQGQLFIVTHSTDALVDDYRHIIRLYRNMAHKVKAACGSTFHFPEELEKHLIMHFPEIKEAFYARSVIIVEGESEYGCFRYLGKTLGIHFDYLGICLINARGESSISKIKKLLESFNIPTVALYDADVKEARKGGEIFYTDYICFEMDVVETLLRKKRRKVLDTVFNMAVGGAAKTNTEMMQKAVRKLEIHHKKYPPRRLQGISDRREDDLLIYYFAWMYGNKGVILGRALGKQLKADEIPSSFTKVIARAGTLARYGCCDNVQ